MKKTLGATFVVTALTLTAACGGGGDDRPSKDELSKQLVKSGGITKKQADCASDAILGSKLSDKALKALADGDTGYKPTAEDTKIQTQLTNKIGTCITG